ncbi:39S ribosomal protein L55, mitochondrial [Galleria mellonella]|uniref:39S ribosomal protein L55, mitochondrial n=1 Tax=Galleria mellonella TaxID=7137 RepID=A0A6J1WD62_GALME|nr:39S ribosomal protein L55, mitochondrial [Galleria mellonella]
MYFNLIKNFKVSVVNLSMHNRYLNNNVTCITKIHREIYARMYPTRIVQPDGASINIRYHEPRKIIKLPLNLSLLSEEERRIRLERRKPKKKVKIIDDVEDNFNAKKYLKFMKKGKK